MAKDKNKTTKQNPVAVREKRTVIEREKHNKEKFIGARRAHEYSKKNNLGYLGFDEAIRAERERR